MEKQGAASRIVLGTDGVYRWKAPLSQGQKLHTVKIVIAVCGGTCLFFSFLSFFLFGDRNTIIATLLSSLAVVLIVGTICWLYLRLSGRTVQSYEMSERGLHFVGYGQSDVWYPFDKIRRLTFDASQNQITVRTLLSVAPFFIPQEDYPFVQEYVLARVSGSAQVEYR